MINLCKKPNPYRKLPVLQKRRRGALTKLSPQAGPRQGGVGAPLKHEAPPSQEETDRHLQAGLWSSGTGSGRTARSGASRVLGTGEAAPQRPAGSPRCRGCPKGPRRSPARVRETLSDTVRRRPPLPTKRKESQSSGHEATLQRHDGSDRSGHCH